MNNKENNDNFTNWLLRFVKGIFIGSGFILPGVSGGAMAAIFGIYERLISFVANITKEFKKNLLFFLPVGFGGVFGIFILSFAVSFFLDNYETQVLWFFIGCIIGTVPALWKQAAKHGRESKHITIMFITFIIGFIALFLLNKYSAQLDGTNVVNKQFPVWAWLCAGGLIGLGVIVPGLSPSNFLIFFGMYGSMSDGIKNLDFSVIIPIGIGVVACVLAFSKLMAWVLKKAYAVLFHIIVGIVLASTIMIVPMNYNYLSVGAIVCVITCALGIVLGAWMSKLEDKYVPDND